MDLQSKIKLVTAIVTAHPAIPPTACLVAPLILEQFNSDLDLDYKLTTQDMVNWFGCLEELKSSHENNGEILDLEKAVVMVSEEVFVPLYPETQVEAVRKNIDWIVEQVQDADRYASGAGN